MIYELRSRSKILKRYKTYSKAVKARKIVNQLKGFKGFGKTYIHKKRNHK